MTRKRSGRAEKKVSAGAKKIMAAAKAEAAKLKHDHVGTEHLLLAIVVSDNTSAGDLLHKFHVDLTVLRKRIVKRISAHARPLGVKNLDMTPALQEVLELAEMECLELDHEQIGTEHLLLALTHEKEHPCLAVEILRDVNVRTDELREVLELQIKQQKEAGKKKTPY